MKIKIWEVALLINYITAMMGLISDNPKTISLAILLVVSDFYSCWRRKNEAE